MSPELKDLREHWDEILPRIQEARHLCFLLDFDGTLTPIVDRPEAAVLSPAALKILSALAADPRVTLGIVTGRSLDDIRARVALERIWYVGNHGYEIADPAGGIQRFYDAADVRRLEEVRQEMEHEMAGIEGVILEHKGPILAVHYRRVAAEAAPLVEKAFFAVMSRAPRNLMVSRGNLVLEARVRSNCNKGTAVRMIRGTLPAGTFVMYAGDDLTDRDAFRALRGVGMSVAVGPAADMADYGLPEPAAVLESLRKLSTLGAPRKTRKRRGRRGSR